ncbi:MAG: hypothetical protein ACRDOD_20765 [Streptosporangiaceae bacterium]
MLQVDDLAVGGRIEAPPVGVRRAGLRHKVVWAELVVGYGTFGRAGLPRRMPGHELAEHAPYGVDSRILELALEALRRL